MLKTTFTNTEPKLLKYRRYRNLLFDIFKYDLTENLLNGCNSYGGFDHIFSCHAQPKKKWTETIIKDFKNHPSCKIIKQYFKKHITFTFRHVTTQTTI